MNVLLINPPVPHILRESLPPVVEDESGMFPPLGLLYVAAYAEQIPDCVAQVLDCQAEQVTHDALSGRLALAAPDVVGIQVMTFTLIDAIMVARTVRQTCPEALIVVGGPHPTIFPEETIRMPEIDVVIPGEGEFLFASLLQAIAANDAPESVEGVLTKRQPYFTKGLTYIHDLDVLNMPARHLIDQTKYTSPLAMKNPLTTIMSSRGCPARCMFCDRPQMGKKFRMRSAVNVVAEMRQCHEQFGINEFLFYDDTFTVNKQRVFDVCNLLLQDGLRVHWDIRARIDTVTPEMLRQLRKAGCHRIHYGVETGSPRIQTRLKKHLNLGTVREVFHITKQEGIEVLGYFMIGCPDETPDDLQATFDLIRTLPMDYAHIGIFTPYPGTEIYREALEQGIYATDYWREFACQPTPDFTPRYWNQYFSDADLLQYSKLAYKQFYSRPSYIIQRLFKLRSFDEFVRKTRLGVKLLQSLYVKSS